MRDITGNPAGATWMVAAMAGFAAEDAFVKYASQGMPVGEVLLLVGLIGIAVFAVTANRQGEPVLPKAIWSRTMVLRSGFEIVGRLFYALAIALTPISSASAILQATPLVVVLGAALIFGERVGPARWLILFAGFGGVLLILRPGLAGFDARSGLAVIGMLGFAGRDLATRAAPPTLSNAQLGVAGFSMLAISGLVILGVTGGLTMPTGILAGLVLGAAVFGIAGYASLTKAMRTGQISAVTPFRYTRLIFAMILGIGVFGETPDVATLLGSALIVMCGLMVLTTARRPT